MVEQNNPSDYKPFIESYGELANDPERLMLAVLKDDDNNEVRSGIPKERKVAMALNYYIEKCKQEPYKVMYYIIESIAEGRISAESAMEFDIYINIFPAVGFLRKLSKQECQEIMENYSTPEDFAGFFNNVIMGDRNVRMRIWKTAPEVSHSHDMQPINWQALLLCKLDLETVVSDSAIKRSKGFREKLRGTFS